MRSVTVYPGSNVPKYPSKNANRFQGKKQLLSLKFVVLNDIHDFIFREECTNVPQQKCKTVINQECTTVQRTVTNNVPEQKCHDVQTDVCVNVPRPSCTTVTDKVESKVIHLFSPLEFYKTGFYTIFIKVAREVCEQVPREECRQVPRQVTNYRNEQECRTVTERQCSKVSRQECTEGEWVQRTL